jgi:hypothetical protein
MKEDIKLKLLNLGSNIKVSLLCDFFSSKLFKKEKKTSRIPQTSFLMLEGKQINLSATIKSSSVMILKNYAFFGSPLDFKLMEMVE